jgi:uncharacterized protein YjeT (DUF2065 family)
MNVATVLAEVIGAVFVLVGLSTLNKKNFRSVMDDLSKSRGLTWTVGIVTFLAGAVTVSLYNVWSSNWEVLVTIVGWLLIIKGLFITLFPNTSIPFYRKFTSNGALMASGIIAIVIGLVLFYLGFMA